MINYQLNNQKETSASQAEGHEFEPRLPLYQALGDYPNKDGRLILFYLLNAPSKSNVGSVRKPCGYVKSTLLVCII
jgi:hypothetical protein